MQRLCAIVLEPKIFQISCWWHSSLIGPACSDPNWVQSRRKQFLVHRLVARTFLGPAPSPAHNHVNHKDGDPSNTHETNLEYLTASENVKYSYATNPNRRPAGLALCIPVLCRPRGTETWIRYPSMTEASFQFGVKVGNISASCSGRARHTGGYEFKHAPTIESRVLVNENWLDVLEPRSGESLAPWRVSSHGRVRTSRGQVNGGYTRADGYVSLVISGRGLYLHRLVARAFLGPPPSPMHEQVNHKDRNKSNNHVDNLEYVTPAENIRHSFASGRQVSAQAVSKPVVARPVGSEHAQLFHSISEAARQLRLNPGTISSCCHGSLKEVGGFKFSFGRMQDDAPLDGEIWKIALGPDSGASLDPWQVSSCGRVMSSNGVVSWGSVCNGRYRRVNMGSSFAS